MKVVIYARFSSHSQTEQSIEGQLKECYAYAKKMGYSVIGEYIDRAISGKTEDRPAFQKMIKDSDKHTFEGVLVYQLDRFARDRYASAIYKARLKRNGVRVISARENIADDASGILIEGVLESMAEYYSVELSQKIVRGMTINAEKCLSNGSNPGFGFKVDKNRCFYVDEEEAIVVREIYERYAKGDRVTDILNDLDCRLIKNSTGNRFTYHSLNHLLKNKRYIGIYLYKGMEIADGMPRILDDDIFYRVQERMKKNKTSPARLRGKEEYLLTSKLYCGCCKQRMTGYTGTSKTGKKYHYYRCKKSRNKECDKMSVQKEYIEQRIVQECLKSLTKEQIQYIALRVAEKCSSPPDKLSIKELNKAIREADAAIEILWRKIENGEAADILCDRIAKRQAEKKRLETQLVTEKAKKAIFTEAEILAFLDYICNMQFNDVDKYKAIINIFVRSVYLYDDHFNIILNGGQNPREYQRRL